MRKKRRRASRDGGRCARALRIETTNRSLLIHIKLPITMGYIEMEDALDDMLDDAMERIITQKKHQKEEENRNV